MIGYIARMRSYLAEMFPLSVHLPTAALTYLATAAFARHLQDVDATVWTAWLGVGVWSYLAVPLMLRLMDELKDVEIDRVLFADRPLPSGRVRESDIKLSLALVITFFIGANLGDPLTLIVTCVLTAYALLMYKRFFASEAHRNSLPLTLATHNPIVPMSLSYGFFLFAAEQHLPLASLRWQGIALFVLMLWMPFLGWELSRKIRAPEHEDAYVTYSQLLGRRGAVAMVCLVQLIGIAGGAGVCVVANASWQLLVLPGIAWLANVFAGVRYITNPTVAYARLRPFAETFIIATVLSALLVFGARLV